MVNAEPLFHAHYFTNQLPEGVIAMKYVVPLALLLAFTTPAIAEPIEAPTAHVAFGDLDLSTVYGRLALESRINQIIRQLCPRGDLRDLAMQAYVQRCINAAHATADKQLVTLYANRKLAQGD